MIRMLTTILLLVLAVPATAQQTVSVTLTAAEVHALQVTFGSDANVQAKMQQWVKDWCVQFVRDVREKEQRELREALIKLTPEQEAAVRKLVGVPTPVAVTTEERAARLKAEQDRLAAEKAAADKLAAELKRLQDEKTEAVAAEQAKLAARLKTLLAACEAKRPVVDCSFITTEIR